jgi:hypothetical protein
MTRKRTRENLVQTVCEPCPYCEGRSYVLSQQSVAYKVLREIRKDLPRFRGRDIAVAVHPRVAEQLLGPERATLAQLERDLGRQIEVRAKPGMHQEQFEVLALSEGPPVEFAIPWLSPPRVAPETPLSETLPVALPEPLAPAPTAEEAAALATGEAEVPIEEPPARG